MQHAKAAMAFPGGVVSLRLRAVYGLPARQMALKVVQDSRIIELDWLISGQPQQIYILHAPPCLHRESNQSSTASPHGACCAEFCSLHRTRWAGCAVQAPPFVLAR